MEQDETVANIMKTERAREDRNLDNMCMKEMEKQPELAERDKAERMELEKIRSREDDGGNLEPQGESTSSSGPTSRTQNGAEEPDNSAMHEYSTSSKRLLSRTPLESAMQDSSTSERQYLSRTPAKTTMQEHSFCLDHICQGHPWNRRT